MKQLFPSIAGTLFFSSLLTFSAAAEKTPVPTHQNVSYGEDSKQTIDIWLAKSDTPTPLVIYIHGGGWTSGDKVRFPSNYLATFMERGISFASINYRLSKKYPLPTPVHDAARALQFIRSNGTEWNLDKSRFGLMGGSAGACTSMWIAFHDDLADAKSKDPVARESTRVSAVYSQNGQTSIDPKWITEHIGINGAKHSMICSAVGERNLDGALKNYSKHRDIFWEFSPINHLDENDPPFFGRYEMKSEVPARNLNQGIHHYQFGIKLMEKSEKLGHRGYLVGVNPPIGKVGTYEDEVDFMVKMLNSKWPDR